MAEHWPLLFALAQAAQAMAFWVVYWRVSQVLALKARPFSHVVCRPGDVVCIELPHGMSCAAVEKFRKEAESFQQQASIRLAIFQGGIEITGAKP